MLARAPSVSLSLVATIRPQGIKLNALAPSIALKKTIDGERSPEHHRLSIYSSFRDRINKYLMPVRSGWWKWASNWGLPGTGAAPRAPRGAPAPLRGPIPMGASPQVGGGQRQGGV
jgi:hypothetical protein